MAYIRCGAGASAGAGKHYLFQNGAFVNEWAGTILSTDINIYCSQTQNGGMGLTPFHPSITDGKLVIPSYTLGVYMSYGVIFPTIPASVMSAHDHILVHFADKNFSNQSNSYWCTAIGHTTLTNLTGVKFLNTQNVENMLFITSSGYTGFVGNNNSAYGTHYTFSCGKDCYSDEASDKHYAIVSTEIASETDPHSLILCAGAGNGGALGDWSISEIYLENID